MLFLVVVLSWLTLCPSVALLCCCSSIFRHSLYLIHCGRRFRRSWGLLLKMWRLKESLDKRRESENDSWSSAWLHANKVVQAMRVGCNVELMFHETLSQMSQKLTARGDWWIWRWWLNPAIIWSSHVSAVWGKFI